MPQPDEGFNAPQRHALQFAVGRLKVITRKTDRGGRAPVVGPFQQMRIVCPNCDAQYEVPKTVVPAEGRDVECSNCGKMWYQHHPEHPPQDAPEPASTVPPTVAPATSAQHPAPQAVSEPTPAPDSPTQTTQPTQPTRPVRREIDPGVADILRQEAAREKAARDAETLEVQTDLNLEPTPDPAPPHKQPDAPTQTKRPDYDANSLGEPTSRRELLPDIEEINSTLRSTADRNAAGNDLSPDAPLKRRQKRSFRRGFVVSVAMVALASLVYVFAPDISDTFPTAGPLLEQYSSAMDDARLWLNGQMTTLTAWLDAQAQASRQ